MKKLFIEIILSAIFVFGATFVVYNFLEDQYRFPLFLVSKLFLYDAEEALEIFRRIYNLFSFGFIVSR